MRKLVIALIIMLSMLSSTVFSFAALEPDPDVTLVNPVNNAIVYSNNLLISVKIQGQKSIRVQVYTEKQMVNGTLSAVNIESLTLSNGAVNKKSFTESLYNTTTYRSKNNLSFYTKQLNDLSPGLYKIKVDTLDSGEKPIYSMERYFVIKEKQEEDTKIFDKPQSGTMQFLQNLLKNIFGN